MATTSGRPNRSRMGFGRCEIPAPRSSMLLSVRFGTNSAMTPNVRCTTPKPTEESILSVASSRHSGHPSSGLLSVFLHW
jgi:hypothetical protein